MTFIKLSGHYVRLIVNIAIVLVFYIRWDHPNFTFFNVGLGIVLVLIAVLMTPSRQAGSPEDAKLPTKVILNSAYIILFFVLGWYWISSDLVHGSNAPPFHIGGLVLLLIGHLIRPGGRFDPDRTR